VAEALVHPANATAPIAARAAWIIALHVWLRIFRVRTGLDRDKVAIAHTSCKFHCS